MSATRYFVRASGFGATATRSATIAALLLRAGWIETTSEEHEAIKAISDSARDEAEDQRSARSKQRTRSK